MIKKRSRAVKSRFPITPPLFEEQRRKFDWEYRANSFLNPWIQRSKRQVKDGLGTLRKLAASTKEITLPVNNITDRTVIAAEAYAYHAEFVAKTPEQYQPPTLGQIRGGADIRTADDIMAHRELERLLRAVRQTFGNHIRSGRLASDDG